MIETFAYLIVYQQSMNTNPILQKTQKVQGNGAEIKYSRASGVGHLEPS